MFENHVIFQIDNQLYSLNSLKVKSIESSCAVESLPGAPENVLGGVHFRGGFYPVYSLRRKFGIPEMRTSTEQFLFTETSCGMVAVLVDSVSEIAVLDTDSQAGIPVIVRNESTSYVAGIVRHKDALITMIDPANILSEPEVQAVERCMKVATKES